MSNMKEVGTINLDDFILTEVGSLNFGIDGWDSYYNVHNHTDGLNHNDLHNLAREYFWQDTTAEAGSYFCKSVSVYMNTMYDKDDVDNQPFEYILVVHHRYDV
jgi:hypothetical protein